MTRMLLIVSALFAVLSLLPAHAQTTDPTAPSVPQSAHALNTAFKSPVPQSPFARPVAENSWHQWLSDIQQKLQRKLGQTIIGLKSGEPVMPAFILIAISFFYGLFHAVGPGHGKAVISAYVLTNNVTLRRGIALSFAAAFVQALTALAIMGATATLFEVIGMKTRTPISHLQVTTVAWLVTISAGLVIVAGAWLLFSSLRRIWVARYGSEDIAHASIKRIYKEHAATCAGGTGCECGHAHMPDPEQLQNDFSWRRAAAIAVAVGIRPCTGALIVLVLAGAQGMYWVGVISTFLMAIGTAITVSTIAVLAVGSRDLALRLSGNTGQSARLFNYAAIGGALLLLLVGVVLFIASLGPAQPF
ncbi:MAG: nickel/cobalt transporter [Alphaproteobacteria bacterium]